MFAPDGDGGGLTLGRGARAADSVRALSPRDAEKWGEFNALMSRLARVLAALYDEEPPRPTSAATRDLLALGLLGLRIRSLGRRGMVELLRMLPMPVADLLDDWFENDALKGVLAGRGVTELLQGPRSSGTSFVLLHHYLGSDGDGLRGRTAVRGGAGRLAEALAAAAREHGAEVRCGADVARVMVKDGTATGVVLRDGTELAAAHVLSSADPRRTLLELGDPLELDPDFVRATRNFRYRGATARVHLALGELPRFRGLKGHAPLTGTISIAPNVNYLERAYDDAKHGGVSGRPYLEASIPSLLDPSLSPAGQHVLSISVQYAPYRLNGGWTAERREALADAAIATLAEYAPNLPDVILDRRVLSPADLEQEYGAPEGSLDHGELTLDQILFMRPVAGWAHYRTPIHNLFLCGAGTHPGGRVAGGAGRLAAGAVLRKAR